MRMRPIQPAVHDTRGTERHCAQFYPLSLVDEGVAAALPLEVGLVVAASLSPSRSSRDASGFRIQDTYTGASQCPPILSSVAAVGVGLRLHREQTLGAQALNVRKTDRRRASRAVRQRISVRRSIESGA